MSSLSRIHYHFLPRSARPPHVAAGVALCCHSVALCCHSVALCCHSVASCCHSVAKRRNLLLPLLLLATPFAQAQTPPLVQPAPPSHLTGHTPQSLLTRDQKLALLRQHVKYVFVLFQENRSFDSYFGTYPGAEGLYTHPAAETPGFLQPLVNVDGTLTTISPFRIPATVVDAQGHTVPLYPADTASVNHSHLATAGKLHLDAAGIAQNDRYALTEEGVTLIDGKPSKFPSLERKQFGELVMAHIDCDTIPFLWRYADRFTLFDNFFDTVNGPSGPNAVAIIAGQSGETQWMLHPNLAGTATPASSANPKKSKPASTDKAQADPANPSAAKAAPDSLAPDGSGPNGTKLRTGTVAEPTPSKYGPVPMVANNRPFWGLALDPAGNPAKPTPNPEAHPETNLTFATLPLSFMGTAIKETTAQDNDPAADLPDIQQDIAKIAGSGLAPVQWGWYQQGYNHEPTDPAGIATHKTYVIHHNGPQYFGYIANNPAESRHLHGLNDFFADIAARRLPDSGVFYVRGGYGNIAGDKPADPNPALATVYSGNDDHPGYADTGISEALVAREIDAIARSPYWAQSAILIAYDETDGLYDHARPLIRSHLADGSPLDQGPRIPFILVSPFAVTHAISHERTEHSSIIKFVNDLFHLTPLADLPDEARARAIGHDQYQQDNLGPADAHVDGVGELFSAFDDRRLEGRTKPLSPDYAIIPDLDIATFPHYAGQGCKALGIRPTDLNRPNPIPPDFNPRPDTTPGEPRSGTWTP